MQTEQQLHDPQVVELAAHRASLVEMTAAVQTLVQGLSAAQWHRSPAPGEWSIAQCIDHLNTVHGLLLPRFEAAIERGRAQGPYGSEPFRLNLVERWFVRAMQPSSRIKQPVPGIYRPAALPDAPEVVMARFEQIQQRLIQCIEAAEGLNLARISAASPVSPLLRLSLAAWFAAVVAHERNHLEQAQRVRG